MTLHHAMGEVESRAFAFRANIAGGMRGFLHAIAHEEAMEVLLDKLSFRADANVVLGRIFELAAEARNPRFEHQRDTAIAAYLWLLAIKEPSSARLAASAVTGIDGFWWARKVAQQILEQMGSKGSQVTAQWLVSHQRLASNDLAKWVDFNSGDDQATFAAGVRWAPSTVRFIPDLIVANALEHAFVARFRFDPPRPNFFTIQSLDTEALSVETDMLRCG